MAYRLRDMLLSQQAYLTAMVDYRAHGGKSRGSALYTDRKNGTKPFAHLPDTFTFALDKNEQPLIQELRYEMVFAKPTGESRALSRRMMISLKMYGEAIVKQEISNNILDID